MPLLAGAASGHPEQGMGCERLHSPLISYRSPDTSTARRGAESQPGADPVSTRAIRAMYAAHRSATNFRAPIFAVSARR